MPHVTALRAEDPTRVGRYPLAGRIAGMPASWPVYLAKAADGSEVTVALLNSNWTGDSAVTNRFAAEAAAATQVAPFCAARIVAAGVDDGQAFLVREYVAGLSLLELIAAEGGREGEELMALAIGAATGLAAIHQAGLVHGDFGPAHLIIGADGPLVVEFGITPPYGAATPAADMLAWAQTVVFAATGRPPASPGDLEVLPQQLRQLAIDCLSADTASRPAARSVVLKLLGNDSPPAGLLAEGSRRAARAAASPPPPPPGPAPAEEPAEKRAGGGRSPVSTIVLAGGAIAAVVLLIVLIHLLWHTGARAGAGHPRAVGGTAAPAGRPGTPSATPPQSSPPTGTTTIPSILAGAWSGRAVQQNDGQVESFRVRIDLPSGGSSGTISWSGATFKCGGDLSVASLAASTLSMNQQIVTGRTLCADGLVTLRPGSSGTVVFTFRGKSGPQAHGTLLARH